jgi:predicted porin
MKRLALALLITAGAIESGHAADLPTTKAVEPTKAAPNCFGSLWDWLNTSISDCPLSYAGFTLYGTLDVGYGYDTAGVPFGNSYSSGVYYGIQRTSRGGRWSWSPNALSPSTLGLKMEEPLVGDWLLIGAAEFGYNPFSGMLANAPRSLADNNLNPPANQIAGGDGSRAGQWDDSQGFVGVSSKTYGTLTAGRVNALSADVMTAYDPVRSSAFSLIGFNGAFAGLGTGGLTRVNTAVVYRLEYGNFRVAGLAQVGNGYALGNGSMGEYQGQVGATFGGFSIDGVASYAKDAVSLSSYGGADLPAGYDPNTILKATLSNNTAFMLAARYTWDKFEFYGGYTYARLANPSDAFPNGFPTIALGIFVLPGAVNSTNYDVNRILNTMWTGGRYNVWSNLSVSASFYYQTQNNFLPAPAICTGYSTGTSSNKCAGAQSAISFLIDYKPFERVDLYGGMMVSNVYGGLASGYIKAQNLDPTVGLRIRF